MVIDSTNMNKTTNHLSS